MPAGFDMNNSPAELATRSDTERPLVLLSSSGTRLLHESRHAAAVYLACFRNYSSLVAHLAASHDRIAVIGAGSRGDFREEDQMCCAWIAELLIAQGYEPANNTTADLVQRWSGAPAAACVISKSVDYLRRSGQLADLDFILSHINDLRDVYGLLDGEVQVIGQCEHLAGDPEVTTAAAEAKVA
jgi:2-phosphosulfolactate phosphatase